MDEYHTVVNKMRTGKETVPEMRMTSAKANKMLRSLNDEHSKLVNKEKKESSFLAVMGEDPETVRPAYDYEAVQSELEEIEGKVRTLKHAIFDFNMNTIVPEFGMTIDEMLIYIPQLSQRLSRLENLAMMIPKEREFSMGSNIVDYRYANFDIEKASADYSHTRELLSKAQMALDKLNNSVEFEVDL